MTANIPDPSSVHPAEFEPQAGDIIRAKWVMDGATDLAEAADRLERFAVRLRSAHEGGWTLAGPVEDDYGFLVSPSGDHGSATDD